MTAGAAVAANVVTINGVATASFATAADTGVARDQVVAAVNAISDQTGVVARNTGSDSGGVELIAKDGRNISLARTTAATAALTGLGLGVGDTANNAGIVTGSYNLTSINGGKIDISSQVAAPATLAKAGLTKGTYSSSEGSFTSKQRAVAGAAPASTNAGVLGAGDLSINGVAIAAAVGTDDKASHTAHASSTKAASAISIAASINKSSATTGVTAKANANTIVGAGFTAGTGAMTINGIVITAGTSASTRQETADRVNGFAGQTGVVATDNGTGLTLTAADGRNITLTGVATNETRYASVTLSSAKAFTVERGSNSNANLSALGFTAGTFGGDGVGGRLSEVSVATSESAIKALGVLDNAIQTVSNARSDLGAKQNRLEYTVNNLSTMVANTSASQSRILDTDYAKETTDLARSQIIAQAGTAMLAQANQMKQTVLSLLQ
jgi:flagellin